MSVLIRQGELFDSSSKPSVLVSGKPSNLVPFGKYKGQPVEVVATVDPNWLEWALAQSWCREKYSHFCALVMNGFHIPEETPEHNRLQMKFLHRDFQMTWLKMLGNKSERVMSADIEVEFEVQGWDVMLTVVEYRYRDLIEIKPSLGDDFPAVLRQIKARCTPHTDYRKRDPRPKGNHHLLIDRFSADGATLKQVRQFFDASHIRLSLMEEISC